MKKYSEQELKAKAAELMKTYPSRDAVYATEDGQFFFNHSLANDHNRKNVKGKLYEFDFTSPKAEEAEEKEGDDLTQVKGIGKKTAEALNDAGISTLEELAGLGEREVETLAADIDGSLEQVNAWTAAAQELIEKADA